jgi:hypothetical protein
MGEISFGECTENYKSVANYGQWQPSYFDMLRTIPEIEFNKGIPEDIDKVDYLDISQRNLIILDECGTSKPCQSAKTLRTLTACSLSALTWF